MSFFSGLLHFAETAIPSIIGYSVAGPVGGALGGALGGAVSGGGVKGALLGGVSGYGLGSAFGSLTGIAGGTALDSTLGTTNGAINFGSLLGLGGSGASGGSSGGLFGGGSNALLNLANLGSTAYSALSGSSAARNASGQLQDAAQQGINAQRAQIAQNTANVQPYLAAGGSAATREQSLINDPNAQKAFIQNNPFFNSLATQAKDQLFSNAAAKGTLGSGGTAAALQNSLLLLGNQLLGQNIDQNQSLAGLGSNAASNLNSVNQSGTNNLTNLITDKGSAAASGTIGGYNAVTGALNNGLKTAATLYGINNGVKI